MPIDIDEIHRVLRSQTHGHWPANLRASDELYKYLLEFIDSRGGDELEAANALHLLFRMRHFGNFEALFLTFIKKTKDSRSAVRSAAVWLVVGWSKMSGHAGHRIIKASSGPATIAAIEQALEIGLTPEVEP